MKNLKNLLLTFTVLIATPIIGMEAPQNSFDSLPLDVKRIIASEILNRKISNSDDVVEVARTIRRLNATNRFFHEYLKNPKTLLAIVERMPTVMDGDFLIRVLRKTNIPVARDPLIDQWVNKNFLNTLGKMYWEPAVINLD